MVGAFHGGLAGVIVSSIATTADTFMVAYAKPFQRRRPHSPTKQAIIAM